MILFLTGCVNYHLTIDEFRNTSINEGYYLDNQNNEYKNYSYVKDVCYAYNRESDYLIQFIELIDDDYAYKFYLVNKEEIEKEKTSNSYFKEQNSSGFNLYHVETDKYYMMVIRMDNSVIYVNTEIKYLNEIESLFKELNIKY